MDSKEETILEAAMMNFSRFGFKKASVDDIARDAGVGKGTIYNYFKNKEDLLCKVSQIEKEKVQTKIREKTCKISSSEEKLKIHFSTLVSAIHEHKRQYHFSAANFKELFEVKNNMQDPNIPLEDEIAPIIEILKSGKESGEFEFNDIEKVGNVFWKYINRSIVSWMLQKEEDSIQEVDNLIQLLIYGLKIR